MIKCETQVALPKKRVREGDWGRGWLGLERLEFGISSLFVTHAEKTENRWG